MGDVSTWSMKEIAIVFLAWVGVIGLAAVLAYCFLMLSEYWRRGGC